MEKYSVKQTGIINQFNVIVNTGVNTPKKSDEEHEKIKQAISIIDKFPNGLTSWIETHHEVVNAIAIQQQLEIGLSYQVACQRGTGGLYELAEELTDKFETMHKDTEWDGEFYETIEEFLTEELKEKE